MNHEKHSIPSPAMAEAARRTLTQEGAGEGGSRHSLRQSAGCIDPKAFSALPQIGEKSKIAKIPKYPGIACKVNF